MFKVKNDTEFVEKYGKIAYKIATKFDIDGYRDMEKEDLIQLALLYLWESTSSYDETKGASFSTYAYVYVYNNLANYFTKKNAQKNKANISRTDLTGFEEDEDKKNTEDSIAAPNDEMSISYRNLRIDIEMQLQKLKAQSMTTKGKTVFRGVRILEGLLNGEEPSEIRAKMQISDGVYKKCLFHARNALRSFTN